MNKKNLLITGATGFVGAHLLHEVIQKTNVEKIYILLRNRDVEFDSFKEEIFKKYLLPVPKAHLNKIKFICGDICLPKLGISLLDLQELVENVDVIYHVAAEVNHIKNYAQLKKANVDSVSDILRIFYGRTGRIINFISTVGAAVKKNHDGLYVEDFPAVYDSVDISMGYLRSKYEAERVLSGIDGIEISNIFRLGYISGSTKTGVSLYENNQLMLFLKSCIQLGAAPNISRTINFTPVDFTASILGSEEFMSKSGNIIHLVNTCEFITWNEIISFLNQEGFNIKIIEMSLWQQLLINAGRENALYKMLLTYRKKDAENHIIRFGKNIHSYKFDNIADFCKKNSISMTKIKYDYLREVINYLRRVGFI